jgi:hypothetical protein
MLCTVIVTEESQVTEIKLEELLKLRDVMVSNMILQLLDAQTVKQEKAIRKLVNDTGKRWAKEHVPSMIGKKEANKLLRQKFALNESKE